MHSAIFRLALAVILAAAVIFLLSAIFSSIGEAPEKTVESVEMAREAGLNSSIAYLTQ